VQIHCNAPFQEVIRRVKKIIRGLNSGDSYKNDSISVGQNMKYTSAEYTNIPQEKTSSTRVDGTAARSATARKDSEIVGRQLRVVVT